ncbi:MAG: glycosyltransferase family 2 protein [Parvularculaceae bacterium]
MKISFIVIAYQAESTLGTCLSSILALDDAIEYEVVIIDDFSADGTERIIEHFASQFANVRAFRNERNSGRAASRNRGLREAAGDYICFVDADDFVNAVYADELASHISSGYDVLATGRFDFDNVTRTAYSTSHVDRLFYGLDYLESALDFPNCILDNFITGKFLNREFLARNTITFGEDRKNAEDILFATQYWLAAKSVKFFKRPFYGYARGNYKANFSTQKCVDVLSNLAKLRTIAGEKPRFLVREILANKYAFGLVETARRARGVLSNREVAGHLSRHYDARIFEGIDHLRFVSERERQFVRACGSGDYLSAVAEINS